MGYSARRGFTNGKISGAARQAELQQKIAAMQEKMTEAQDAVEAQEFTASVGGGVVEAKVNGKKEVLSVTIKPEAVDPEDVEMLQDLVVSAVNEALRQANEVTATYVPKKNQEFDVELSLKDKKDVLMNLRLTVPTEIQAEHICDHWQKKSNEIYDYLMTALLSK